MCIRDRHEILFNSLPDPSLQKVATDKMEGYGAEEIAERMGIAVRTVYRKLDVIKSKWSEALDS